MLANTGSSTNIVFLIALKKMGIENIKMESFQVTLVGFYGVSTMRIICLLVYIEGVNRMIKFMVIDCLSTCNAIFEGPRIHAMKSVPFTYHQVIRFPIKRCVREIQGDQEASKECYNMVLRSKHKL